MGYWNLELLKITLDNHDKLNQDKIKIVLDSKLTNFSFTIH